MKIYDKQHRLILDVIVDDNSYRNRVVMGDHSVTLYYSLPEHVEIPVGAFCTYEGETYTLMRPEQLKMKHSRLYEYTVQFSSEQEKAKIWKFRNPVDGRLKFPLTAKPKEHLQMFVDNMNRRDTGWTVGDCIEDVEKLISYDHDYCWDALGKMATEFETEFEISAKKVSLKKVEYNKSNPLPLAYGKGNGFKPGIGRSNTSEALPVEILYVQGGDTNIDRSKYPKEENLRAVSNGCLLLPTGQTLAFDGEHFEGEDGFNSAQARHYQVDDLGLYIRNIDHSTSTQAEDSLDRSDDYPKRVGTISKVEEVDKDKNFYDIIDSSIPANINYEDYLIGEDEMSVIFQSGMLAGKEFDVKYCHEQKTVNGKTKAGRRFEIVPQEIDGIMMPGDVFVPKAGDTYAVFHVMLPDAYIRDDATKSGASWDMFRAAARYLFDNEEKKLSFTGELDGIWAKRNWDNIGGKIRLGGFIEFTHDQIAPDGVLVRITSIKDYINKPHSPKIELSNETIGATVASTIKQLQSTEVVVEANHRTALQFTKRRFRDAKETIEMIEDALSDSFTNRINPIAVETMSLLVGDERLQYQFVDAPGSMTAVAHNIEYREATKQLVAPAGTIQHLTLGIDCIRPSHQPNEYLYWNVASFQSANLTDGSVKHYLYIRAQKQYKGTAGSAEFRLETSSHKLEEGSFYWLLVGVLNTEYDGERSFATLYGFTEILPGRITADRLLSTDGESYFDMLNAALKLKDRLQYNINGDGELRVKGIIVQSQNGVDESPLGCYRGDYDDETTYFNGDDVTYRPAESNPKSSYRCISPTPITGIPPTDTSKWQVIAAGVAGEPGAPGISPNASYKSTVFKRTNTTPTAPTGGSYNSPVPIGWSDGIPSGEQKLWASTRIFSTDGKSPQQSAWTTPRQMTDTADFDVEFSTEKAPLPPEGHPNTNTQWSNESSEETIWMATSKKSNGVWGAWQISRIKGENGEDGTSIRVKGTFYGKFATRADYLNAATTRGRHYLIDHDEELNKDCVSVFTSPMQLAGVGYRTTYTVAEDGDGWVDNADGHLYLASGEMGWQDIGKFKGDDGKPGTPGKSAYVHIKYANSMTENDWTANNGETPGEYIGIYSDNDPKDQLVWSLYSWKKWTGQDGLGYEYIYQRTTNETAPPTPTETSQDNDYVPDGWTDDPTGVSEAYPFEWLCYRKKTEGVWGEFIGSASDSTKAALWAKYGQKGDTGATGNYTEYRFAVNGSTTSPPTLVSNAADPAGWTTAMPTVSVGKYLWMTKALKTAAGSLVSTWSTPVRMTAKDGEPGKPGASPVMVYRGRYSSKKTFYGNEYRLDCVKEGNEYFIARIDAGTFSAPAPPDESKWNRFGASFESVATQLLLAELATIGNWFISGDSIASTHGTINGVPSDDFEHPDFKPDVLLDGTTGSLIFANGMELDTNGLSLISGGYSKLRIVNGGIGRFTPNLMLKTATIPTNGKIGVGVSYLPYAGERKVTFNNSLDYDMGFLDAGSKITIDRVSFAFTVPTGTWNNETQVYATTGHFIKVQIIKDGKSVMAKTFGSFGGVSAGESVSDSISLISYTIPEGEEGGYSVKISGDELRLNATQADQTKAFDITIQGQITFIRNNHERTVLGNDGLLSCWGNGALYMSADAFMVQLGNFAIRITESGGIQKTSQAIEGTGWNNL